jgi:hypothetical protein
LFAPEHTNPGSAAALTGNDTVLLSYKGAVTEDLISNILLFIESKFKQVKTTARVKRKIISVLVEALQNIFRHGQEHSIPVSEVTVYQKDGSYLVVTGNRIDTKRALELKQRVDLLNNMSKDELTESYRHILLTKAKSSADGSGVGMIDMLRRSGAQINFTMDKLEGDFYFCSMEIKVGI